MVMIKYNVFHGYEPTTIILDLLPWDELHPFPIFDRLKALHLKF